MSSVPHVYRIGSMNHSGIVCPLNVILLLLFYLLLPARSGIQVLLFTPQNSFAKPVGNILPSTVVRPTFSIFLIARFPLSPSQVPAGRPCPIRRSSRTTKNRPDSVASTWKDTRTTNTNLARSAPVSSRADDCGWESTKP